MSRTSPMIRHDPQSVRLTNGRCDVELDLRDGTWSAKPCGSGPWVLCKAGFAVDEESRQRWTPPPVRLSWRRTTTTTCFGRGLGIELTVTPEAGYAPERMLLLRLYPGLPFVELAWGVRNRRDHPIRVRTVAPARDGLLLEGRELAQAQVLNSGAGAERTVVASGSEAEALNGLLLTWKEQGVRGSIVAGGLRYGEYGRRVAIRGPRRRAGATADGSEHQRRLTLEAWDPQGKWVAPGETFWSRDTSYLDLATADPFEALEAYGMALRKANRADPNLYDFPTLCGWMVSTASLGEGAPINNSAALVEQARMAHERGLARYTPLAVRLEPDTYCYGNQGDTQQGWWDDAHWRALGPGNGDAKGEGEGSLRKPHDTFASFCKAVAELGCVPFTYFQSSMPSNDFAAAHPDWMLGNDISLLHATHPHHRPHVRYDFTDPGFRDHCRKVWQRLRKAGLRGVKFDYPETAWAHGGGFEDRSFTTVSAYRELFRLCRAGLGRRAFLHERNLGGATHENAPCLDVTAGLVDIQRVWGDASHFEPEMASRMGLRWYKSRAVFLYYPDGKSFFHKGRPLPAYRRRAFLSLIAFLSGRLELGTSIGRMTDEMFHDLTRLYPVFGGVKSPRPVDMLTGGEHPEVYVYDVTPRWLQVLLVNNDPKRRRTVRAPLSGDPAETGALGLDAASSWHAFEFWEQRYLGCLDGAGELAVSLRPGEVAVVSLRKVTEHPQVISTNRHLMQGMLECHDVRWRPATRVLGGSVDLVGGEPFHLTLACNGHEPAAFTGAVACRPTAVRGIVDLVFESPRSRRQPFRVEFQQGQGG